MSYQTQAEQVKARLAEWLAPEGLAFNEDKTRIVNLDEGFDFLGFTVRRLSGKLLIKPSKAALRRIRERLRAEMHALRGANAAMVLVRLNPIIRGWAAYYRTVVSSKAFLSWIATYGGSPTSGPSTVTRTSRGTGSSTGTSAGSTSPGKTGGCSATAPAALTCVKFAWTSIVRHQMVKGGASPDDPALAQYWADRRRRGAHTANPAQWEQWVRATPQAIRKQSLRYRTRDGSGETSDLRLIHTRCRGRPDAVTAPAERLLHASEPSGLA